MYAIIQTGGKQYKVANGDVIYVEKLPVEAEETVTFDQVLAFEGDDGIQFGTPALDIPVVAKVVKNGKGKKITVMTYKSKKNEKRKMGHRQPYTKLEIVSINGIGAGAAEEKPKKAAAKKAPAKKAPAKKAAPKAEEAKAPEAETKAAE